jgi:hypothetical protein
MEVNLDLDTANIDIKLNYGFKLLDKWTPYISNQTKIKNKTTRILLCAMVEYIHQYNDGNLKNKDNFYKEGFYTELTNYLNNIDYKKFNLVGEKTYNLLTGESDANLVDGKTLSYYTETEEGGMELFEKLFTGKLPEKIIKEYKKK